MTERRRRKQKTEVADEPTKEELQIAKHVRFQTPKKSAIIRKEDIEYFVGSKAVDTLLESKYAKGAKKGMSLFKNREECCGFLEFMLHHKMFYRAKKIPKEGKPSKEDKKSEKDDEQKSVTKRKKGKEEVEDKKDSQSSKEQEKNSEQEKKKKRRYMIDIHDDQCFLDSSDIYVWIYEPLHPRKLLLGGLILLGIVVATLFPLWPPWMRIGVYYSSLVGGVFVGSVLLTALFRSILFLVIWVVTIGRYHIWLLPNLLADVGFFDSFKPAYTIEYRGSKTNTDTSSHTDGKEKQSDEGDAADVTTEPPVEFADAEHTFSNGVAKPSVVGAGDGTGSNDEEGAEERLEQAAVVEDDAGAAVRKRPVIGGAFPGEAAATGAEWVGADEMKKDI